MLHPDPPRGPACPARSCPLGMPSRSRRCCLPGWAPGVGSGRFPGWAGALAGDASCRQTRHRSRSRTSSRAAIRTLARRTDRPTRGAMADERAAGAESRAGAVRKDRASIGRTRSRMRGRRGPCGWGPGIRTRSCPSCDDRRPRSAPVPAPDRHVRTRCAEG